MSLMLILFAMIIMEYPKMDCISVSIIEQSICLAPERGLAPHPFLEGENRGTSPPFFLDLPFTGLSEIGSPNLTGNHVVFFQSCPQKTQKVGIKLLPRSRYLLGSGLSIIFPAGKFCVTNS